MPRESMERQLAEAMMREAGWGSRGLARRRGARRVSNKILAAAACAIIVTAVSWVMDVAAGGKASALILDKVEQTVPANLVKPAKKRGSGAAKVNISTDLSKPGGGTISQDDSWQQGLGKGPKVEHSKQTAEAARLAGRTDFSTFHDGDWVTGVGVVTQILSDDTDPPRHQRFIIKDYAGHTLLVAHNIDLAMRLDGLASGDEVAFRGEYRTNSKGGVIHWTHTDPNGKKQGGWLRKR